MTNVRDSRVMVLVVVVYSRFSSTCVFFFPFFFLISVLVSLYAFRDENSDLQTYRNTASRGADGRSEGNTRARINWILRKPENSSFAVSRRVIEIGRKDDAIFATICARKEKMAKKKKYIYIYVSLEACNYRALPSWKVKFCEKTRRPNKREQN